MNRADFESAAATADLLRPGTTLSWPDSQPPTSWIVRALLGTMGWLGGMLVMVFFAIFVRGLFDSAPGLALLSASLFALAFAMYRKFPDHDFANQFAFAASVCGQALGVAFLFKLMGSHADRSVAVGAALMQIALVILMPNYLHRLVSSLFAILALLYAARQQDAGIAVSLMVAGGFAALAISESKLIARGLGAWVAPVWTGVGLGLLAAGGLHFKWWDAVPWYASGIWTASVFGIALFTYVFAITQGRPMTDRGFAGGAVNVVFLASINAPGIAASALVLLAAFHTGRRAMTGIALFSLIAYIGTYYYQTDVTLLKKSIALAGTGALLIGAWAVHRHHFKEQFNGGQS
jgi:hypothetical protein